MIAPNRDFARYPAASTIGSTTSEISPGLVLPSCVHGGPGRAGGGEELGGERGLAFYMQRVAIQGFKGLVDGRFGESSSS